MPFEMKRMGDYIKVVYSSPPSYREWYINGTDFPLKIRDGELRIMGQNIFRMPTGSFLEVKGDKLEIIEDGRTIEDMMNQLTH